jgi:tetratricopeptide (TPR) repeat protein
LLCGALVSVAALPAYAKKPAPKVETADDEVVRLSEDAVKAYKEARYDDAIQKLTRAYAIRPVVGLLYNLAKAYEKLGDVVKAYENYKKYVDTAPEQPAEQRDQNLESKAQQKVASLEAAYQAKKASDKTPDVTRPPVGPSPEELALRAEAERKERAAQAAKEEQESAGRRRRQRNLYLGIGVAGLGVVSFAVGLGLYSAASSDHSQFVASEDEDTKRSLASSGESLALGSTVLYCVGLVAVGASAYFWYAWARQDKDDAAPKTASLVPTLVPLVSPTGAGGVATWRF